MSDKIFGRDTLSVHTNRQPSAHQRCHRVDVIPLQPRTQAPRSVFHQPSVFPNFLQKVTPDLSPEAISSKVGPLKPGNPDYQAAENLLREIESNVGIFATTVGTSSKPSATPLLKANKKPDALIQNARASQKLVFRYVNPDCSDNAETRDVVAPSEMPSS